MAATLQLCREFQRHAPAGIDPDRRVMQIDPIRLGVRRVVLLNLYERLQLCFVRRGERLVEND